jgi:hypothetical protein
MHPEVMNDGGIRRLRYILRDDREMGSRGGASLSEVWFTRKLVGYISMLGHLIGMEESCLRQNWIESQPRKAACHTILIRSRQQRLFGHIRRVAGRLRSMP